MQPHRVDRCRQPESELSLFHFQVNHLHVHQHLHLQLHPSMQLEQWAAAGAARELRAVSLEDQLQVEAVEQAHAPWLGPFLRLRPEHHQIAGAGAEEECSAYLEAADSAEGGLEPEPCLRQHQKQSRGLSAQRQHLRQPVPQLLLPQQLQPPPPLHIVAAQPLR